MPTTEIRPRGTRVAVFGPVEELPPSLPARNPAPLTSPAVALVLQRTAELIAAHSPEIASPILDRALAAGTITGAERAELLSELVGVPEAASSSHSPAARRLRCELRAAIARAAPSLARPLLDEAVASERLTLAQELRILERLHRVPLRALSSFL
jgi:hypothetical protein